MLYAVAEDNHGAREVVHSLGLRYTQDGKRLVARMETEGKGSFIVPPGVRGLRGFALEVDLVQVGLPGCKAVAYLHEDRETIAKATQVDGREMRLSRDGRVVCRNHDRLKQLRVKIVDPESQRPSVSIEELPEGVLEEWVGMALVAIEHQTNGAVARLAAKKPTTEEKKERRKEKQKRLAERGKATRGKKGMGHGKR